MLLSVLFLASPISYQDKSTIEVTDQGLGMMGNQDRVGCMETPRADREVRKTMSMYNVRGGRRRVM